MTARRRWAVLAVFTLAYAAAAPFLVDDYGSWINGFIIGLLLAGLMRGLPPK